jgi:hypothetical protein
MVMTVMIVNTLLKIMAGSAIMGAMKKEPDAPAPKQKLIQVKAAPELLNKLDELRRGRISFPTRSDIIRELIEKAYAARMKGR